MKSGLPIALLMKKIDLERYEKESSSVDKQPFLDRSRPREVAASAGATPRPDVVVVTVNEHETKAIHDAFLEATGADGVPVSLEGRLYHNLGSINGTTVYHAISEMGSSGPGAMQQAVDKAIRALEPGAVIALGIAFGVRENDQSLGDILLSRQIQLYDLQRAGIEIVLRGDKPHATPRLINHFDAFSQVKWKGAKVRSGLILSGEKLIDDKDYRDQLVKLQAEAVGGEMEGAGLYVASADHKVDWIVIKAICDWADGNKKVNKKQRQKKAAKNAAQFLVESLKYAALKRVDPLTGTSPDTLPTATGQDPPALSSSPANVSGRVVYSERKEWIYSNLLKVVDLPERIYVANTTHRFAGTVWTALHQGGGQIGPEWLLTSKRILSFHDLRQHPWKTICDQVRSFDAREWSESDDPDRRRDFVRLLNHCLRAFTRSLDLHYNRELDCYYFPATLDLRPGSLTYRSLQQNASRDVFAVYYRKNQPDVVSHFRHSAFGGFFQQFGREWYLQITPTYLYTVDGQRISRFQGELLSGIKRFDRNAAVLGQIVMWGDFLAPEAQLFAEGYPYLRFGKLERFQVNREINDDAWATQDITAPEGGERPDGP
jgi:nucleoside phosphorylase